MNKLVGANVALRKKLKTARENRNLWRREATNASERNGRLLVRVDKMKEEIKELNEEAKKHRKSSDKLFTDLRRLHRHGNSNS